MSDHSGQSHSRSNQRAKQSMQCYPSVWMARWTHTSCSDTLHAQNGLSLSLTSNDDRDVKKFIEVTDTRTIRVMNESEALTGMFNFHQNISSIDSKNALENIPLESGSREPATQMISYRPNKGKAQQLFVVGRQEKVKQIRVGPTSKEKLSNNCIMGTEHDANPDLGNFSILGRDKYWDDNSTSRKFEKSISRGSNTPGSNLLPLFVGEPSKKMQNIPHTETFQKSVNLTIGRYPFRRMPGSVDELSETPAKFSETTQNMLFLKNTDIKKSKQKEVIELSANSIKSNRNMFSQLLSLSPPSCLGQKSVKIQLLDSSSGSQEKQYDREILNPDVSQRNESSAETAIMDMETFRKQNTPSGVNSATSNKKFSVGHDPPSQTTTISVKKRVKRQLSTTVLPDMNEIPVLQASSSSMDNAEPSTSKTQSLDAGYLLSHNEQPINQNTSNFPKSPQPTTTLEPSSRWLKRLKLSVPHSFDIGTKSSSMGEALTHQKVNKLFNKAIVENKTCIPDQSFYRFDGKKDNVSNQSSILQNPSKKDLDSLLSHSWIKRWSRSAIEKKKVEALVLCDPQSTKLDFDELQNKQFPSIGAMAMMGKAMTGFQPCEIRKRGSLVVWDTKGL